MCGIFGVVANESSKLTGRQIESTIKQLLVLSESRGKEAAGLAFLEDDHIRVYKKSTSGSAMLRLGECRELLKRNTSNGTDSRLSKTVAVMGQCRLVTNGALQTGKNNQPVITGGMVGVHNGIIVNDAAIWEKFPGMERQFRVDTEILLQMIRHFYSEMGSLVEAVQRAFAEIEGVANIAVFLEDFDQVLLATNNGSLYLSSNAARTAYVFASEESIVRRCLRTQRFDRILGDCDIDQIQAGTGCLIDLPSMERRPFQLDPAKGNSIPAERNGVNRVVEEIISQERDDVELTILAEPTGAVAPPAFLKEYDRITEAIDGLRRCSRCVLPETVPFLDFDEDGVCDDCRRYQPFVCRGEEALAEAVAPHRRDDGKPDCLIPLSGGRDSCYTLHYAKNVLGMHPIAYTYDWGMVTDLARRNQMRMCGKLGIEHILVSANLRWKRRNIRKNVQAWLKNPKMGIIPLFMAGDKQAFYHADRLRKRHDIGISIFGMSWLEDTDFKSGYCGIDRGARADYPGSSGDSRMIMYYAREFLANPGYWNASLLDTMKAYFIYYLSSVHSSYITIDDYVPWDEERIISTLRNEYNWELSPDTTTTWRIGDGTAAFYNYIYYTVGGFTEIDTFRSNQVRAGMLTRGEALELVRHENKQRYESMAWYCETISINLDDAIRAINAIPKRYSV